MIANNDTFLKISEGTHDIYPMKAKTSALYVQATGYHRCHHAFIWVLPLLLDGYFVMVSFTCEDVLRLH
jgi:hypothetical protein